MSLCQPAILNIRIEVHQGRALAACADTPSPNPHRIKNLRINLFAFKNLEIALHGIKNLGFFSRQTSAAPVQRNRSRHRVRPGAAESGLLQSEVPLGRLVRVIDQHQRRSEAQARAPARPSSPGPAARRSPPKNFSIGVKNGTQPSTFQHATTSIRQVDARHGRHRGQRGEPLHRRDCIVSYRRLGSTKSMVVVTGPCAPSSLYGRLLLDGACAAMRKPALRPRCSASRIGSKCFCFSWMLPR